MHFTTRAILMAAALIFAIAANAQPRPGGGPAPKGGGGGAPAGGSVPAGMIIKIQAEQIAKIFGDAGFQSKVIDNNKIHMVQTVFWTSDIFSGAIPNACEDDGSGCHAFQIFANLGKDSPVNQAWMDAWNSKTLYVHASMANGELIFSWDVGLLTGITSDYIKTSAQLFKYIVDQSTDFKP